MLGGASLPSDRNKFFLESLFKDYMSLLKSVDNLCETIRAQKCEQAKLSCFSNG